MNSKTTVNTRNWVKETLSHVQTERIPYNFFFTPLALKKVKKFYGSNIEDSLEFPIRIIGLESLKPIYAEPSIYGKYIRDEFGVLWSTSFRDRGSPIGPCLAEPSIAMYKFPDPVSPYRYKKLKKWLANKEKYITIISIGDLWERATFMRGMENILMDLTYNENFVYELMEMITDYNLKTMLELHDKFKFDGIFISDDYGMQHSMIMSPNHWKKFVKPYLKKLYDYAKSNEWIIFHHSCGYIIPIIGDLIEIGLDILNPIQPETMNIFDLKREFGKYVTFYGGVSTQKLLPFASPIEIKREVKKIKEIMGKNGGYITGEGVAINDDIPLNNIIAYIDEAMK